MKGTDKRIRCMACGAEHGDPDQRGLRCYETADGLHVWSPIPNDHGFMDTGTALEIVHAMATSLYRDHGELCDPANNPAEAQLALDTVEDFIVNKFEED